jgi:glycosyltransferase involved in cell wall biosynthesis
MKIAVYNRGIPFDGNTPFVRPLGGSETSIVHMARELALCGHDVTVYCRLPEDETPAQPKAGPGCRYEDYRQFFRAYGGNRWDVLISFRSFEPFLLGRIAPRMIFWCGDDADQPVLKHFDHPSLQNNIDLIFCVSEWHRKSFIEKFGLPQEKVVATRNGFCPEIVPQPQARQWTHCIYSSTPFRGLEILLKMFPRLRERNPSLTLDVFSSMCVYGWSSEADQQAFGAIYRVASQPGAIWRGSVAQPVLMEHLTRSGLFLYPNTFAETSCIAAIEAQACGCVVVTSARAALSETVENGKTGICISGDPACFEYQREFINTVNRLLQNPQRLEALSHAARDRAFRTYRWSSIASEWSAIFKAMPAIPVHERWTGPLTLLQKTHEYVRNGNMTAASRVLRTLDDTPFLRKEIDVLKGTLNAWM